MHNMKGTTLLCAAALSHCRHIENASNEQSAYLNPGNFLKNFRLED